MVSGREMTVDAAIGGPTDARVRTYGPGPEVASERDRLSYQPALDGVRAIAILSVLASHMFSTLGPGGDGVDVFFVLSGFLITTLLLQEHHSTGRISLRAFWWRRAARLLPALLVMCPVVAVASILIKPEGWRTTAVGIVPALLYVSAWVRASGVSDLAWMGHTWSLSVEEWFYFGWPLCMIAALRRGSRATAWIIAAACLAVVYRLVSEQSGLPFHYLYNAPDQRACQLLIGCAAGAGLFALGERRGLYARAFIAAGVIGSLVVGATLSGLAAEHAKHGISYISGQSTVIALGTAAAILSFVVAPRWLLARTLAWRPLIWTGRRSYGLYLWHFPIFGLVLLGQGPLAGVELDGARVLAIGLSFGIAAISFRYVERPAIRWVRNREAEKRRTHEVAAAVPAQA
jgi:peptidoglycan/LPS O-acetylase OafA/YrhL